MDCSKTINFFAEAKRLCDSRTGCTADAANKEQCPLSVFCKHPSITRGAEYAKKLIENLQKWSDEPPKKTYAQDFFEKFPNAKKLLGSAPTVCRKQIYPNVVSDFCSDADCVRCWNQSMEE